MRTTLVYNFQVHAEVNQVEKNNNNIGNAVGDLKRYQIMINSVAFLSEYVEILTYEETPNDSDKLLDFSDYLPVKKNDSDIEINASSGNSSYSSYPLETDVGTLWVAGISSLLSLLILATILGNVFVIAAILMEKNLKTVGNYLVLSLAMTDLMVACLVMPLGAVYEVSQKWILGPLLCDVWTSCDVLCCTASILHLLAIATDRYWAVTNVDYVHQRSVRHIGLMILLVWTVALLVSIAPFFGWKDPEFEERIHNERECLVNQDLSYQIFATFSSFFLPLLIVLVLYWRIYKEARKRIRRKPGNSSYRAFQRLPVPPAATSTVEITTTFTTGSSSNTSSSATAYSLGSDSQKKATPSEESSKPFLLSKRKRKKTTKESAESKRERKAAKTLAIITGIFVACWLPFFIVALMMPMCSECDPGPYVFSVFLWLGYANSMLNPIIYTVFSPDFRCAFKRMVRRISR
ncbi:5-hydroxytryptamine receptor-like [Limulus polyphemus]|uniref:5-hydroxytryptamine receptor-like n=1 Tax=Limulus polyphemus TaxID=6850 RepID=A0ABM1BYV7_LIMPO|nr:5-hydroxytryptamine receptor-like [Limulus polyphemus]